MTETHGEPRMNKTIAKIIDKIIETEGGYVNHPDDPGGPTNYGITLETLENWLGHSCNAQDVKTIRKSAAREIYYSRYYIRPGIDKLPDPLHHLVLDSSVHHGPYRAVKLLQQTIYRNGGDTGPLDGLIGPKTINASNSAYELLGTEFINQLVNTRVGFVDRIAKRNPALLTFRPGWVKRIEEFRQETT